jgi:nicotinate-nucleotide--dimethylbenzimidazole phosphoribosyltransferase
MTRTFDAAVAALTDPDLEAATSTREHLDRLTKPPGSLGRLEAMAIQLAAIAGVSPPPVPDPVAVAVFAGDHGVVAQGVTPWPQEVTAQMVANFRSGGAAINVLARHVGASVLIIDVGVATEIPEVDDDQLGRPLLLRARVAAGTGDLTTGPAMSSAEVNEALDVGAAVAARLVHEGARCLVTGDMGIGNTTPSSAVIAALTGRPAREVTGRGTGIDDERLALKVSVVERGTARLEGRREPIDVLKEVGGLEIAALTGFIIGGAAARVPVVVDGVIAMAALIAAVEHAPGALPFIFAGHRSAEPGASAVLTHLGLEPVIDLGLRLGEGTGACLAVPVLQAAARIVGEMATFDSAGVSSK